MQHDLVVQAQRGDVEAFSALTAGRTNRLYAAARLILRDDEQAADAVQDALLQAWLDLRSLRDPDRFDAWLRRLLVRACYRAAKRRRTARGPGDQICHIRRLGHARCPASTRRPMISSTEGSGACRPTSVR